MRKFLSISVTVLFQAIGVAQPEETRFDQIYRVNAVTQTVFCSDYRAKYPDLFRCMYDQNSHSSAGPYYSREPCPSTESGLIIEALKQSLIEPVSEFHFDYVNSLGCWLNGARTRTGRGAIGVLQSNLYKNVMGPLYVHVLINLGVSANRDSTSLQRAAIDLISAERMQVPFDFCGAAFVVSLAGITGRRIAIQPKALDSDWRVTPNLWGAIVGPPGFMKSPVISEVTRPLREIEARWLDEHQQECAAHERTEAEYKLKHAAWSESYKHAQKKPTPSAFIAEYPGDAPEAPARRRAVVNDSTVEALHAIMSANPAGVLVLRDELVGWMELLDKQGNEGARQFHLEAWNGDGFYQVDRIGRGNIGSVLCESLFGGIQPSKLQAYVAQSVNGFGGDDGLIQRLQIIAWPDAHPTWRLVDRPPNREALSRVRRVFSTIAKLEPDAGRLLRFDEEAQGLFYEWWTMLECRIRGDELHPAMASHLSKYRKLMPALAGLFVLADWAAQDGDTEPPTWIGLEHARHAAAWCDYLEAHAGRLYACVSKSRWIKASDLCRKLKAGKLVGRFSLRDLYFRGWSGLSTATDAREACDALIDLGWLRRVPVTPGPGRPPEEFVVNPAVFR